MPQRYHQAGASSCNTTAAFTLHIQVNTMLLFDRGCDHDEDCDDGDGIDDEDND